MQKFSSINLFYLQCKSCVNLSNVICINITISKLEIVTQRGLNFEMCDAITQLRHCLQYLWIANFLNIVFLIFGPCFYFPQQFKNEFRQFVLLTQQIKIVCVFS